MNPKRLQSFPSDDDDEFENEMKSPVEIDNDDDDDDDYEEDEEENEGYEDDDESMDDDYEEKNIQMSSKRKIETSSTTGTTAASTKVNGSSELTLSFEGELYVFQSVTYQKVEAVLLLLGGRHESTKVPAVETSHHKNNKGLGDHAQQQSNISGRRTTSSVRSQKKRKVLCFDNKGHYNCRDEVAQRMPRKKGQFRSLRENQFEGSVDGSGLDCVRKFPQTGRSPPKNARCKCQHCGVDDRSTPVMRRGPAGPRSLCNACGLKWASKGTLRDLSKDKTKKKLSVSKIEQTSLAETEVLSTESDNAPSHSDDQGSPEDVKPPPVKITSPVILHNEETSEDCSKHFPVGSENLAGDISEKISGCGITAPSLWGDLKALSSDFWDMQGTPDDLSQLSAVGIGLYSHLNDQF